MTTRGQEALELVNWNDESWRIHLEAFIVSQGLEDKWEEYKEAVAEEEMDESQPGWDAEEEEEEEDDE